MKKQIPFCDFGEKNQTEAINRTRFYKHKGGFTWQGIKTEEYKTKGSHWTDVMRRVIIGSHHESAQFHLRYFEISPGGFTSFEKHKHEHVVVGIRGKGKVLSGKKYYELNFLDTLYIAPDIPHQLSNPFHEPFGFFCMVNAKRDKPKIMKQGSRIRGAEGSSEKPINKKRSRGRGFEDSRGQGFEGKLTEKKQGFKGSRSRGFKRKRIKSK